MAGGGASQTTFADIAPAQLFSGGAAPGNPPNYLTGVIATNERAHTGATLLATGATGGQASGDHHPLLPASR